MGFVSIICFEDEAIHADRAVKQFAAPDSPVRWQPDHLDIVVAKDQQVIDRTHRVPPHGCEREPKSFEEPLCGGQVAMDIDHEMIDRERSRFCHGRVRTVDVEKMHCRGNSAREGRHDRRMVRRLLVCPGGAVDDAGRASPGERFGEQNVIDAKPGVALESVHAIVPPAE